MQSIINSNHILLGTQALVGAPIEVHKFDFSDNFVSNFRLREILKSGVSTCELHNEHDFKISVILTYLFYAYKSNQNGHNRQQMLK